MRERAAQELNPKMGRMGAEVPSTAFPAAPPSPDLLPRLGAFARLLHDAGMEAGPRRLTDATRALGHIDIKRHADFRNALRSVFVSRKEDLSTFDAAFDIFWSPPDPRAASGVLPGRSRSLPMSPERAKAWANALGLSSSQMNREQDPTAVPASASGYSAEELLRHKDFEQMTWQETEQVRRLLEEAPYLLCLLPGHLLEVLVPQQFLGAIAARARGHRGGVLLAVHLRAAEAERVRPRLGPLRGHRQRAAASGQNAGGGSWIWRRPEDVEGRIERGEVFLAAHEHRAQCVPEIGVPLDVDVAERAGRVGQPPRTGLHAGVMQQLRECPQPRQ